MTNFVILSAILPVDQGNVKSSEDQSRASCLAWLSERARRGLISTPCVPSRTVECTLLASNILSYKAHRRQGQRHHRNRQHAQHIAQRQAIEQRRAIVIE